MITVLLAVVLLLCIGSGAVGFSRSRLNQRNLDRALNAARNAATNGRVPQALQRYRKLSDRLARPGTPPHLAAQRGLAVLGQATATPEPGQALALYREAFPLLADPVAALPPWALHGLAVQRVQEGDRPEDLDPLLCYLGAVQSSFPGGDPSQSAHSVAEPVLLWLQSRCAQGGPPEHRDAFTARALAALPRAEWTVLARAAALRSLGRLDEARAVLTAAGPGGSAEVWFRLGAVQSALGHDQEAVAAFTQALVRPPGPPGNWGAGRWARAVRLPAEIRLFRGLAQQRLRHWEDASDDLLAAVRADPGDARAHYALGSLALHSPTPDPATALACFTAAVRTDPDYAPARFGLGLLHEWAGQGAAAAAEYRAGTALRPDWRPGRIRLGAALSAAGQQPEACRALAAEAARPPDAWNDTVTFHLGLARARADEPVAALDTWQELADTSPERDLDRDRAVLRGLLATEQLTQRQPAAATRLWQQCSDAFPEDGRYRAALAEAALREAGLVLLTGRDDPDERERADAALQSASRYGLTDSGSPRLRRLRGILAMLRDDAATAVTLLTESGLAAAGATSAAPSGSTGSGAARTPAAARSAAIQLAAGHFAAGQPRRAIALLAAGHAAPAYAAAGQGSAAVQGAAGNASGQGSADGAAHGSAGHGAAGSGPVGYRTVDHGADGHEAGNHAPAGQGTAVQPAGDEAATHRLRSLLAARAGGWSAAMAAQTLALRAAGPDRVTPGTPCAGAHGDRCTTPAVAACGQCGRPGCARHLYRQPSAAPTASDPAASPTDAPPPTDSADGDSTDADSADADSPAGTTAPTAAATTTSPLPTRCHTCIDADLAALLAHALRADAPEQVTAPLAAWAAVLPADGGSAATMRGALARIRLRAGDLDGATAALDGADAATRRLVALRRASAAAALGDYERTFTDLREAQDAVPDDPTVATALPLLAEHEALAHARAGRHAQAWIRYHELWQAKPQDIRSLHSLGLASYRLASDRLAGRLPTGGQLAGDDGEQPDCAAEQDYWTWTMACWAAALHHPDLWPGIAEATGRPVPDERATSVRGALIERIRQDLRGLDESDGPSGSDSAGPVGRAVRWELECHSSQVMADAGVYVTAESTGKRPLVCGPVLLQLLAEAGSSTAGTALGLRDWLGREPPSESAAKLRPMFQPLGGYWFLVDQRRFEEAVTGLRALSPGQLGTAGSTLLADALLASARDHHAHLRWGAALTEFAEAVGLGAELSPAQREDTADAGVKEARRLLAEDRDAHETAVAVLELALRLVPGDASVAANLSAGYAQLGLRANNKSKDFAEAVRLLRKALVLAPDDPTAREFAAAALGNRADELLGSDDQSSLTEAEELLVESLELDPGNAGRRRLHAHVLYLRAKAVVLLRDGSGPALRLMTASIETDPDAKQKTGTDIDQEARRRVSVLVHNHGVELLKAKKHAEGVSFLTTALGILNDPVTRQQLAGAYANEAYRQANQSQFASALTNTKEGLTYEPDNSDLLRLQGVLRQRGYR
ncbi:hypothetical protein [Streptacidiphilus sp. EB129]|uniref:hypothetical protein n=1 Tax=Streptacidiphilus sp. EB129 TaxID=3156262 RepID=UPI003511ECE3